jgi:hypothetical protein
MALNSKPWCDYVVFTPTKTQWTRFIQDAVYWERDLLPALRKFYFGLYLPTLTKRIRGQLAFGEVFPVAAPLPHLTFPPFPIRLTKKQKDVHHESCKVKTTLSTRRDTVSAARQQQPEKTDNDVDDVDDKDDKGFDDESASKSKKKRKHQHRREQEELALEKV